MADRKTINVLILFILPEVWNSKKSVFPEFSKVKRLKVLCPMFDRIRLGLGTEAFLFTRYRPNYETFSASESEFVINLDSVCAIREL